MPKGSVGPGARPIGRPRKREAGSVEARAAARRDFELTLALMTVKMPAIIAVLLRKAEEGDVDIAKFLATQFFKVLQPEATKLPDTTLHDFYAELGANIARLATMVAATPAVPPDIAPGVGERHEAGIS